MRVRVRVRAQKMACGCVRRTLRILCDVRAGAGQKVRTLKVCPYGATVYGALSLLAPKLPPGDSLVPNFGTVMPPI